MSAFKKTSRTPTSKDPTPSANPYNSELPSSVATGQAVASSTTSTPSVSNTNNVEYITECATAWSVICFALTTSHTAIFAAMAPMIFFMFEAVSCMASRHGRGVYKCENTTRAAMFLSCYLVLITMVSIASMTVPQEQRGEGITYSNLAILRLKMKEKVQGALGVVAALVSMYLFSVLGVEGAPNETIKWMGLAGAMTLGVAALIEFASIAFRRSVLTGDGQSVSSSGILHEPSNIGAEQRLSLSNLEENTTVAGFV